MICLLTWCSLSVSDLLLKGHTSVFFSSFSLYAYISHVYSRENKNSQRKTKGMKCHKLAAQGGQRCGRGARWHESVAGLPTSSSSSFSTSTRFESVTPQILVSNGLWCSIREAAPSFMKAFTHSQHRGCRQVKTCSRHPDVKPTNLRIRFRNTEASNPPFMKKLTRHC